MKNEQLMWLDIETTGLDPIRNVILEVGLVVTDLDLKPLDEMSVVIFEGYYPDHFRNLDPFIRSMHMKNGLIKESHEHGITLREAQEKIEAFLLSHEVNPSLDPPCGSSVHFDRNFISEHMPEVDEMFHYRNIDISTMKELCRRYNPALFAKAPVLDKELVLHRAIPDIRDTLGEAKFYLDNFLFI